MASKSGKGRVVQLLLQTGKCSIFSKNKWGHTALHDASKCGHSDIVGSLLSCGANPNAKDRWSNTPLMYATLHGHKDIAETLVDGGCDTNIGNKGSRNALHTAAQNGHTDIVRILLLAGAQMDIQDADGNTPALLAGMTLFHTL